MKSIKKSWIIIAVIILLVIIMYTSIKGTFNKMVTMDEGVSSQWAQVENVYQRRSDLIPNLVATVKGYAEHERETFEAVTQARSKATSVTIDPTNLNEASMQQFQAAQDQLSSALSRLLVVVEKYPDLKANQNFLNLQEEISDIENKLAAARRFFNSATKELNNAVEVFPANIVAGMFGFKREQMFDLGTEQRANLDQAPKLSF